VSDAGALAIGPYVVNSGGPHLSNPIAIQPYTDRSLGAYAKLDVDSTYDLTIYHTMNTTTHQDVKATLFIDFNNNFQYDIPEERVFTGYSTPSQPFINGTVTIPASATVGVLTGMRLIVNEDAAPNVPSDEACGTYTSGETEDYAVVFFTKGTMSVPATPAGALGEVALFPNPTTGTTTVSIAAARATGAVQVEVTSLTGQVVQRADGQLSGGRFSTTLDLGRLPRGVYTVTLRAGGERAVRKLVLQ